MEIFSSWEWWQIALTAIFGIMWLVFIILDTKRKIAVKKRRSQVVQDLKRDGLSDEQIQEYLQVHHLA